jgi:hypothetical protein
MVGTKAGLQAGRPVAKPSASSSKSAAPARGGVPLGLPAMPAAETPQDYRHLIVLGQFQNMKDLGNDAPFGIQATNNGEFRRILKPGTMPYDWFWDT